MMMMMMVMMMIKTTTATIMFAYTYLLPHAAVAFFLQAVVNVDRDAGGSTWNAIVY